MRPVRRAPRHDEEQGLPITSAQKTAPKPRGVAKRKRKESLRQRIFALQARKPAAG